MASVVQRRGPRRGPLRVGDGTWNDNRRATRRTRDARRWQRRDSLRRPIVVPWRSGDDSVSWAHTFPDATMRFLFLSAFVIASLSGCAPVVSERPTSIVMLMADGAGLAHWTLALNADPALAVQRMGTVGLVDTRGADHTVSGSAPTATAYATGRRSRMGYVGVDADGRPVQTVLEEAMSRGKSTGLITTTAIVDATPAAFAAHNTNRGESGDIARQMGTAGVTVLLGGGRAAFRPSAQADGRDLLRDLRAEYSYVEGIETLRQVDADTVSNLLGLFAEGDMGIVAERGDALSVMTAQALSILGRDPDGFFLMIENEESDTQSHRNSSEAVVTREMLDFARVVDQVLAYQSRNPETLVVVTSDHETGGITLTYENDREPIMTYATSSHTGVMVPLFAAGPGSERFGGIIRNDRVGQILKELVRD